MFNPGKGTYSIQFKWGLFLFENPVHQISEYLSRDVFIKLLHQNFNEDEMRLILHTLDEGYKVIIDFKTYKAHKVEKQEKSFESYAMKPYFTKASFAQIYEQSEENNDQSRYFW